MARSPEHDPEGKRCILTSVRTLERDPAEERLDPEQLVDDILSALEREGLFIVRMPRGSSGLT